MKTVADLWPETPRLIGLCDTPEHKIRFIIRRAFVDHGNLLDVDLAVDLALDLDKAVYKALQVTKAEQSQQEDFRQRVLAAVSDVPTVFTSSHSAGNPAVCGLCGSMFCRGGCFK